MLAGFVLGVVIERAIIARLTGPAMNPLAIVIVTFLVVIAIRSKFRRTTVHRVEEELGLGGGIDAEAAEQVVEG